MKTAAQRARVREMNLRWIASPKGQEWKRRAPERDRRRRLKLREFLHAVKSVPCADCGGSFDPVCMDFDHRPGEQKLFNVAAVAAVSLDKLRREIAKCDVVCANCHRLRTKGRTDAPGIDNPQPRLPL